jgi:hypothetical protein
LAIVYTNPPERYLGRDEALMRIQTDGSDRPSVRIPFGFFTKL